MPNALHSEVNFLVVSGPGHACLTVVPQWGGAVGPGQSSGL